MARPSSIPCAFLDVLFTSPPDDPASYIHCRPAAWLPELPPIHPFPIQSQAPLAGTLSVGCGWGLLCRGMQRRTKGRRASHQGSRDQAT